MDIDGRINQANGRLKVAKIRATIQRIGDRLYVVATLPPKPGSSKIKPHQQRIALGLSANPEGVKLAEKQARRVGALLDCNEFSWNPYLRACLDPQLPALVKDWVTEFEQDYFTRRAKTPKSLTTWKIDYLGVFRQLPQDQVLSEGLLKVAIANTPPDTKTRRRFCMALGVLAKFAGIDFDTKPLRGRYSPKRVTPRDLPDDKLIAESFYRIKAADWRWAYGMLATYGLRPHELFHLDLANLAAGNDFINLLDGKTGPRRVWPIFPEWREQFELDNVQLPKVTGRSNADLGNRVAHAFKRFEIPFKPYDLRHCWAIRSLEFGLDVSLAAQQMGHSVQVHTDLYHLWISDRHHQRAFEALMNRSDRPKAPDVTSHYHISS
ncbi:MAG TPA: site-specific integrase [Coleofasciculaceae cyanobacterium]